MLWIGTEVGGLNLLNRETGEFSYFQNDPSDPFSISNNEIISILEDSNGILWIGTDGGGLNKYIRETNQFIHYNSDNSKAGTLSDNVVSILFEDSNNILWIGTIEGGLNKLIRNKTNNTEVQFIVYENDPDDSTTISDNSVLSIYEDHEGSLWIGTNYGLNRFNPETEVFIRYFADKDNTESLSSNIIWSIYQDSNGIFWIGTGRGLNKYNITSDAFYIYNEQDGLSNNVVYGILEDSDGFLWMSTESGLSKFNPETEVFKNYGFNELHNLTFFEGAYFKNQDGEMFFGGMQGFNIFEPENIKDNLLAPQIIITDLQIFNNSIPIGLYNESRTILEKTISETEQIDLSYKDAVFSFEFAALDYTNPELNQYAYKMEGFDKEWNYIGTRRIAVYTNLPAGTYIFRVKGSNNDGMWNEDGYSIRVTMTPPPWQTWWAYTLYAIALVLTILIYVRYRTKLQARKIKIQKKQLEQERLVTERL